MQEFFKLQLVLKGIKGQHYSHVLVSIRTKVWDKFSLAVILDATFLIATDRNISPKKKEVSSIVA